MATKQASLTEQIFKGSFIVIVTSIVASPLGYGTRILLSRSLSTESYGLFYAVITFFLLFSSYTDLGLGKAVAYYISKLFAKNEKEEIWLISVYALIMGIISSLLIAAVVLLSRNFLAESFFKSAEAKSIIPILTVFFLLECISLIFKNIFVGLQKVQYYSLIQPLRLLLTFCFSALLFYFKSSSLIYFSLAWMFAYILTIGFFTYFTFRRYSSFFGRIYYDKSLLKNLGSYAVPNIATGVVHQLNSYADTLFLTLIRGVQSVGLYNIIVPIIDLPSLVLTPLTRVFFPMIASLHGEEEGKQKIVYFTESFLKIIPLITLYFNVFIFLFARTTIATLFSYKWVELAEKPLILISISYLFTTLVMYLSMIIEGMGLLKQKVKITTILLLLNIVINPIAITLWGINGLIIVNSFLQCIGMILYLFVLSKRITFAVPLKMYAKYFLFFGSLITFVKLIGYSPTSFVSFIVSGMLYTIVVSVFASKQHLLDAATIEIISTKLKAFPVLKKILNFRN